MSAKAGHCTICRAVVVATAAAVVTEHGPSNTSSNSVWSSEVTDVTG